MIRWLRSMATVLALGTLLSGCASTISSNVIAFHEWPADMPQRTFAFRRTPDQDASLEYRGYEDMVRNELSRLGYIPDTGPKDGSALVVTLSYDVRAAQLIVIEPYYDPFWYGPGYYPGWGWRHGGFYDPFWGPPMRQTAYPVYSRRLHVLIMRRSDGKPLYEVEVTSEGGTASLPVAMPYMVRSAFTDFPGQNGVMHTVKLKMQ
ncbi:MAG: hypothetical protein JWP38_3085 [Herbaspirillum sp.]|nr:hypothetical protein [Herbaspirillum sp.]